MKDSPLAGKYLVERTDGRALKSNARYFVLNYATDPYARQALRAYADACAETHPRLAADIREKLDYYDETHPATVPPRGQQAFEAQTSDPELLAEVAARRASLDPSFARHLRQRLRQRDDTNQVKASSSASPTKTDKPSKPSPKGSPKVPVEGSVESFENLTHEGKEF